MKNYKNLKIHLLSTNNSSQFGIIHEANQLHLVTNDNTFLDNLVKYKELYITDDSKINDGDWFIREFDNAITLANINSDHNHYNCEKIIATTDKSLNLPQIPTQYIQHYISEYNKGNQLKTVDVLFENLIEDEYGNQHVETINDGEFYVKTCKIISSNLKLNSNNEITIKPVKESWSKEELKQFIIQHCEEHSTTPKLDLADIDKWLKQNL